MRGVAEEEEDQDEDHAETKIKTIIKHVILDMSSKCASDQMDEDYYGLLLRGFAMTCKLKLKRKKEKEKPRCREMH